MSSKLASPIFQVKTASNESLPTWKDFSYTVQAAFNINHFTHVGVERETNKHIPHTHTHAHAHTPEKQFQDTRNTPG